MWKERQLLTWLGSKRGRAVPSREKKDETQTVGKLTRRKEKGEGELASKHKFLEMNQRSDEKSSNRTSELDWVSSYFQNIGCFFFFFTPQGCRWESQSLAQPVLFFTQAFPVFYNFSNSLRGFFFLFCLDGKNVISWLDETPCCQMKHSDSTLLMKYAPCSESPESSLIISSHISLFN